MTLDKLKAFIDILLVSRYTKLPRQEMCWGRIYDGYNLLVLSMMNKTEFNECQKHLHLSENNSLDMTDQFAKGSPLLNSINKECLSNCQPTEHISADESMVAFIGRHGAKQYIHGKPIKFGYKLWFMATLMGYFIQFRPYAGKDTIMEEYDDIGLGLGASVVANLAKILANVDDWNYHIAMDNFFTSAALVHCRHWNSKAKPEGSPFGTSKYFCEKWNFGVHLDSLKYVP